MCRKLCLLAALLTLFLAGCADGVYKVPREEYRSQVKTLGVLPLLVDGGSEIRHPERRQVLELVRRASAGREVGLVELLRDKKAYFDVRVIPGDGDALLRRLARTRRSVDDATGGHRYRFQAEAVARLAREHVVDALLVVIIDGAVRSERRWDRTRLSYLEAAFNSLLAYAAVVLPSAEVVWEYRSPVGKPFLALQYPDFDEAHYNYSDQVRPRYLSLAGLERALAAPAGNWFGQSQLPEVFHDLFKDLAAGLKPGLLERFPGRPAEAPAQAGP
jgi:hypothetical protein